MIKQTLFFSTPVSLSLKNSQLVISWKDSDEKVTRPIEDKYYFAIAQRVGEE